MGNKFCFLDLGLIDYQNAWDLQQQIFNSLVENKGTVPPCALDTLILCEHPHVYTLGKSGHSSNLLIKDDLLKKIGASFFKTDRGGDITYHGPGQIVGYPILYLEKFEMSLKDYIYNIEEVIIQTINEYGINGGRLDGATGVWLDPITPEKARKICAIGVKASRFITMHGFALNVNTDLDYFSYINPCGFVDKGVTSMQKELGYNLDLDEIKKRVCVNFEKIFKATLIKPEV